MYLQEILNRLNNKKVSLIGNPMHSVTRISSPEHADENSLCVIWDENAVKNLNIKVPIVAPKELFQDLRDGLVFQKSRELLPDLLSIFSHSENRNSFIHPSAVIEKTASISPAAYIGAGAYIGNNCSIGENTIIEPNVTLLSDVKVGENCLIHSGAVIGCDGFGFIREDNYIKKIPQIGGVEIKNNVEIGACTTIDRGTIDNTFIGTGTKIDNHVQIGHNVKIGSNCIICSMSGIAGSSIIEDNVTISVQVGVTDHVKIGKGAILAARTGVTNDVPEGVLYSGFPARPHNDAKRALVLAADLPSLYNRIRKLERKINNLEENK